MARIRTVKPELFLHEVLFDIEHETGLPIRLAFIGLWTQCDREGRFKWRPRRLGAAILPYDNVDFSRVLDALATRGFVEKYSDGRVDYGCIPSWDRHQVINNRESASQIPSPPQHTDNKRELTRAPRVDDAWGTESQSCKAEGKGREGKGREGERAVSNETDAEASHDPVKVTFDAGVRLLTKGGQNERQARSLIGKWRKDHGDAAVFDAMARAQRAQASEPVSFIMAALKPRVGPLNANGLSIPDVTNA